MKRNYILDKLRAITIISMILYHFMYDLVYIYKINTSFFTIEKYLIWQMSIALSFFIISGISTSLSSSKKSIKNGFKTYLLGLLISITTIIFMKSESIYFGVLSCLGICMIFLGTSEKFIKNINYYFGFILSLILFFITYQTNNGYFSFINKIYLPEFLYKHNLYFLGFPNSTFSSSDYYPILPWIFMYITGYFLGLFLKDKNFFNLYGSDNILAKIGRHSLLIYILHQPVILLILNLFI